MLIKNNYNYIVHIKFCNACGRGMMDNEYICRCKY